MKARIKKKLFLFVLAIFLLGNLNNVVGQPEFDDDVQDTPIDGGVTLLLSLGATLGLYKSQLNKKKENM